jgi:hypothetical protein
MKELKRFIFTAAVSPSGLRSIDHARASTTKSGFPGGWGIPIISPVAMYSLVSQKAVVGAKVAA